jgi:ribonuclease P/MRP protein subunit POP5
MKPLPPTLRRKKRYMLAIMDPPGIEPDPRELYHVISGAATSIYGDAAAAEIGLSVISAGSDLVIVRYTRGYDTAVRVALTTVTAFGEQRIALRTKVTSGTLHALRRKLPRKICTEPDLSTVAFKGQAYYARRYHGQKVDLLEKGIKRQELLYITQDDLEES